MIATGAVLADSHLHRMQDTEALRGALPGLGLIAFVGDGAVLPRSAAYRALPCFDVASSSWMYVLPCCGLQEGLESAHLQYGTGQHLFSPFMVPKCHQSCLRCVNIRVRVLHNQHITVVLSLC